MRFIKKRSRKEEDSGKNYVRLATVRNKTVADNHILPRFQTVAENDFIFWYACICHGFGTVLNGLKNRI